MLFRAVRQNPVIYPRDSLRRRIPSYFYPMQLQNDLLLRTLAAEKVERPPVWMMRQAGRILPQYRAIRGQLSGFKELVKTPQLAAEVTIQPVDEFGVDAAIIFSDILVIPEAMGLPYELVEKVGPIFNRTIQNAHDIAALDSGQVAAERLTYVYEAIAETKKQLNGRVPLIGFAGAPWTILSYMLEGKGSKTFSKAKRLLYSEPKLAHALLEKITLSTIAYLKEKLRAGVDVLQVFDSWAGILSPHQFKTFALPYLQQIADAFPDTPMIVFARGAHHSLPALKNTQKALGIDWTMNLSKVRESIGNEVIIQGNLDPCLLYSDDATIQQATIELIKQANGNHIANLGHGVYPDTDLEKARIFVETVKKYRYSAS